MKNTVIFSLVLGMLPVSAAFAGHEGRVDYARVIDATPIYERVARTTPHRECWTETVRYEEPAHRPRSATGTLLGTMIGAAVGHNLARSKEGQRVGRVAGAILGASIGSDISRRGAYDGPSRVEYHDEQRCEVQHTTEYEDAVVGYNVTYQYHGRTYHTRMDEDPGSRIRVAVDVHPLYSNGY